MKEIVIRENEAGQRLDKLLAKYLRNAPKSFLYKMMRKKNITLNGKKADGSEITVIDDVVRIFLADDTYEKFAGDAVETISKYQCDTSLFRSSIIYEDKHIILINKPSGVLSQKAKPEDISVNEMLIAYLLEEKLITPESLKTFRPAICNRLDRNTSGLLIAGKTLVGLQQMSSVLQSRQLHKYYQCVVAGNVTKAQRIDGYLFKNERTNQVRILDKAVKDAKPILTEYTPVKQKNNMTLLEVLLITGRSHQIRAHLSSIGHPIIGDAKYGNEKRNQMCKKQYGVRCQMLHAYRMCIPHMDGELSYLSGKEFTAKLPDLFVRVMES